MNVQTVDMKRIVGLAIAAVALAACETAADTPSDVVQAAAQAFVQGYQTRDLSGFEAFFATPAQVGDTQGLALTWDAAHELLSQAQPSDRFELRSFDITEQREDAAHQAATVHYRADVSVLNSSTTIYAATVEQDVALSRIGGTWKIVGGDPPQITTELDVISSPAATPQPVGTISPNAPSIDIHSGPTAVTLGPDGTASVPADASEIDVLVHYLSPIPPVERPNLHAVIVSPSTLDWLVEVKEAPTANTYAFALRGTGTGYMSVSVTGALTLPPIQFVIQVGSSSPAPTVSTQARTITLADDGQNIPLRVGERFLLDLGEGYTWTVNVEDQTIVARVVNVTVMRGAQDLYEARAPGTTTLSAGGDPTCRQVQPACALPSLAFRVDIVVQ